jgi:uncharacterized membrane protein
MLLILLQAILWTINPFFRKQALVNINKSVFQVCLSFGNLLLNSVDIIREFSWTSFTFYSLFDKWILICILVTYISSYNFNVLTTLKGNISDWIPIIQPIVIVLTVLIDTFYHGKTQSINKIVGVVLILLGLAAFNMKGGLMVKKINIHNNSIV